MCCSSQSCKARADSDIRIGTVGCFSSVTLVQEVELVMWQGAHYACCQGTAGSQDVVHHHPPPDMAQENAVRKTHCQCSRHKAGIFHTMSSTCSLKHARDRWPSGVLSLLLASRWCGTYFVR
eukprot:2258485-Amphidinium_carterae.1